MNRYVCTAASMNALAISMNTDIGRVSFHGNRITLAAYTLKPTVSVIAGEVGLPS